MNKNYRKTKGQEKMTQYVNDLLKNIHFRNKMVDSFLKKTRVLGTKSEKLINEIGEEWSKLNDKIERFNRLSDSNSKMLEIADEYGLDSEIVRDIFDYRRTNSIKVKTFLKSNIYLDFCRVNDRQLESTGLDPFPKDLDISLQSYTASYPVSIDIHRFASRNDVLDFVEKRWKLIEEQLGQYRNQKVRFRRRKIPTRIYNFIWKHRKKKAREIKSLLNDRFPKNRLMYYEILKLKSLERVKRTKKIIKGQ